MHQHRFLLTALVLVALAAASPAGATAIACGSDLTGAWQANQQTETFSKTVPLGKSGSVDVSNISGNISVTGGTGDQVVIDALKRGRSVDDLKTVTIEVSATDGRVEVRTRYPQQSRHNSVSVTYTITVPKSAVVNVRSISGDLKVATVDGELRAETVSGDVDITSAALLGAARSVSGDVTIQSVGSAGDLTVNSVSGGLTLKSVKARSVDAGSVSGDLLLADVSCDRLNAKSISGDITFGGPFAKGGRYSLQSHSGDLQVYATEKMGFELNASSFSGTITSDLALTVKFGGDAERGRRRRQEIRGTFGDGSAVLELNAFSGDVRIVKK